jgi:hypothetical protein
LRFDFSFLYSLRASGVGAEIGSTEGNCSGSLILELEILSRIAASTFVSGVREKRSDNSSIGRVSLAVPKHYGNH